MRIGIDLRIAGANPSGPGIYVRSLVEAINQVGDGDEIITFSGPRAYKLCERRSPRL